MLVLDRLLSLSVAFSLAFLVWLYARSRDPETIDNVPIPVQITLTPGESEHYDVEIHGPAQVPVSFRGPASRIRDLRESLQRGEVQVVLCLSVAEEHRHESRYATAVRVDASDVHAPP